MDAPDHKLIPALLLSLLSSVVLMGMLMAYLVLRWRHVRGVPLPSVEKDLKNSNDISRARHWPLKRPNCWLAIQNPNLLAVQSALSLHNPKRCSWLEGLAGDGGQKLFVSPRVSGWILVMGSALPDPAEDVDACFRFLLDLSRKLGQVQFFSANGMLHQHAWAQADGGQIVRGYAWAGKTLWNQGKPTRAEKELKIRCHEYGEDVDVPQWGAADLASRNADKVHLLAAHWSVDPDDIDEHFIEDEWGIVGEAARRF
jgi:hypothetical protein